MSIKVKKNYVKRPDLDVEYVDLETAEPRGVGTCCICNSGNSWCIPEQVAGNVVTSSAAQTISYWWS